MDIPAHINKLQWRNRLAHGTYTTVSVYKKRCRGCEFEPHLEHYFAAVTVTSLRSQSF